MNVNPFIRNGIPVSLSPQAQGMLNGMSEKQLLALLLANDALSEVGKLIQVVPVLDTSAYAAGDVLFDTTEIPGALRNVGGSARLVAVTVIDQDDQTAGQIDLVFLSANVSLGTVNAGPSITDANAAKILGIIPVPAANFIDLGGVKVATVGELSRSHTADSGTSLFVAGIARGTPTQTAAGIKLNFQFRQD